MARKWLLNEGSFIDPSHDAGSYVNARVAKPVAEGRGPYVDFTADVVLADCSRSIRWTFGHGSAALEKVRTVIERLQRFERALIEGQRQYTLVSQQAQARHKRDEERRQRKSKTKRARTSDAGQPVQPARFYEVPKAGFLSP